MDRFVLLPIMVLLVVLAGWNIRVLWSQRTRGRGDKLRLFRQESEHVLCMAGEAHKDSWAKIHEVLSANSELACDVICGPLAQVESSFFGEGASGLSLRERRERLRREHPIFRLLREKPAGTYRLWLRRQAFPSERHYAIGRASKKMFLEWHHGSGRFRGGVVVGDRDFIREKEAEHEYLRSRSDICLEVTWEDCQSPAFTSEQDFPFPDGARSPRRRELMAMGGS